jgi:hypothetical protein
MAMKMEPMDEAYQFSREDNELIERVRAFVAQNHQYLQEAGEELDTRYSIERAIWRSKPPIPEEQRKGMLAEAKAEGDERTALVLEIPNLEDWQDPKNRFLQHVLHDFVEEDLSLDIPSPTEGWARRVILITWVITYEEADKFSPRLTEFQDTPWLPEVVIGRFAYQHLVDWERVLPAVRRALDLAESCIEAKAEKPLTEAIPPSCAGDEKWPETLEEAGEWLATQNVISTHLALNGEAWMYKVKGALGRPVWGAERCRSLYRVKDLLTAVVSVAPRGFFDSRPPGNCPITRRLRSGLNPPDFEPKWKGRATTRPS